ncbi:hypothetical protein [Dokdonia sp.]|uniref:hypothetical protein n=1 Tax=Dokdonia sp. TaxID=2024995 RepID=UPI003266EC03
MEQILKQSNKMRVAEDDLENIQQSHGGYDFYEYNGKPFSGYMVMDYHPNGFVMFEEEYKEGEHVGWDNLYYENGQLNSETLMVGATPIDCIKYDDEGNITNPSRPLVSSERYEHYVKTYNLD